MPRGRPKSLSAYEKIKVKKIREFLSDKNISRFDELNDAMILRTIRISDDQVFISLEHHDNLLEKIAQFIRALKKI